MLRKRSRAVSSKQGLMSDHPSLPSPTSKTSSPTASSSLFASPRLFVGYSAKGPLDTEPAMSPTSILETKSFSSVGNPFFSDRNSRKPIPVINVIPTTPESRHHRWDNGDSKPIGLGIVDALHNDQNDRKSSKQESRMVLFGSQLKIQIPSTPSTHPISISPTGSMESPHSLIEFGIKSKNSQLALLSPARRSPMVPPPSPGVFAGCLSASEMELSEDYTCVIAHGPNPRTTHIFDNCIVESCGDGFATSWKENRFLADSSGYPSDDFLTCCYACKKSLGQGKDIFMYRGEKAFCSSECRYQEMLIDEAMENTSSDPSRSL